MYRLSAIAINAKHAKYDYMVYTIMHLLGCQILRIVMNDIVPQNDIHKAFITIP
jgi:hypothetical protein